MSLYGDPDPNFPDRDVNGKKYKFWYDQAFAEQKVRNRKEQEERLRQIRLANQEQETKQALTNQTTGGVDTKGCLGRIAVCVTVIGGIWAANNWDMVVEKSGEYVRGIRKDLKDKADKSEEETFVEKYLPFLIDGLEVDEEETEPETEKKNETSALQFNDNKTLVLYPEHALDGEKIINPQWRLQLV